MEGLVKKFQGMYKQVREHMDRWDQLQSRLLSQYRNASAIIERLPLIRDKTKYGNLRCIEGIEIAVFQKQMESLEEILLSIDETMEEFDEVVKCISKIASNREQLVKTEFRQPSAKQLSQRVGIKPTIQECLDGLKHLYEIHRSECCLKKSVVEALPKLATQSRADDLSLSLSQFDRLLADQPNIDIEEVERKYDQIFAEEI